MIGYALIAAVFGGLVMLFLPIHRLARRKAQTPRLWEGILLLSWTLIWVGVSEVRDYLSAFLGTEAGIASQSLLIALAFGASLLVAALIGWLLKRRPDLRRYERRLEEIGQTPQTVDPLEEEEEPTSSPTQPPRNSP